MALLSFSSSFLALPPHAIAAADSQPPTHTSSSSSSLVSWISCTHARAWEAARLGGKRRGKALLAAQNDQSGPGDSESKQVLDAFFLGKAFADTVNERLGTAVGEFLSEVGRKQAEKQKEVRKFQEEVQERARLAKIKASRQALSKEDAKTTKNS